MEVPVGKVLHLYYEFWASRRNRKGLSAGAGARKTAAVTSEKLDPSDGNLSAFSRREVPIRKRRADARARVPAIPLFLVTGRKTGGVAYIHPRIRTCIHVHAYMYVHMYVRTG